MLLYWTNGDWRDSNGKPVFKKGIPPKPKYDINGKRVNVVSDNGRFTDICRQIAIMLHKDIEPEPVYFFGTVTGKDKIYKEHQLEHIEVV